MPLKKLTIEHLRGSVTPFSLTFDRGKKLTILYGENGSGKSTVCDAFEFLGKGIVGSLENKGLGRTNKYWPSLGKQPSDVSVTLECVDETTCQARIVRTSVITDPADSKPYIEVLRRSQILSLIEATAANRYAAIQKFIDVSGVETSEATLRELIRSLKSSREVAVARVQENHDSIKQFWQSAGSPKGEAVAWAESQSKVDALAFDLEIQLLDRLQSSFTKIVDCPATCSEHEAACDLANKARDDAATAVKEALEAIATDAGEVMKILEAAQGYLSRNKTPSQCPLCESAERTEGLSERIDERLSSFAALRSSQAVHKQAETDALAAKLRLESARESTKKYVDEFNRIASDENLPSEIAMPEEAAPLEVAELTKWLESNAALVSEWRSQSLAHQDTRQFLSTLQSALKTYQDNMQSQRDLDILIPNLETALTIVEDERRKFSDEVLAGIADEVGRLYEEVHPGEGLNKISLQLDPARRASLDIGASFCGEVGAPPQAYFSESHLDTLGLCVFLALAALDGPENTILVLDDVLASVDEPHVDRLIEMLYGQASKFRHCVITTHYRPWKQKLRWGWLKNGQCQFVELAKWTNHTGLTTIRSVPDVDRLRSLLSEAPPDPQLVCAKAGVILEAALDFLTQLYECSIPRRAGGLYTLGDLLPSISSKLRKALIVEVLSGQNEDGSPIFTPVSLTPIIDELIRIAQARNVFGCHFNTLSFDLLDTDALGFGQKVVELMDALSCNEAGWPRNDKSGRYWATAGETRRLYPLQQPV
jgi:energy-coupling factor transporter ATP-binding protein EcfA2